MPEDCIFCKIRDGEIPSEKLHSDVDCFVIRDINPAAPTHLLIIPTRHFATLSELGGRTRGDLREHVRSGAGDGGARGSRG